MNPKGEERNQSEAGTVVFTLRFWPADQDGHAEWRGRVQNVMSGESHYFREWEKLFELLQAMVGDSGEEGLGA